MSIRFIEKHKVFKLDSKDTSYIIAIVDEEQFVGHVYFGNKIVDENVNYLLRIDEPPYVPSKIIEIEYHFMIASQWNIQHMV